MPTRGTTFISDGMQVSGSIMAVLLGVLMLAAVMPCGVPAQTTNGAGIKLIDAVRIAVERQPDILLRKQDVEISKGGVQIQSGAFDNALQATYAYQHQDTPLTEVEKKLYGVSGQMIDTTTGMVGVTKLFRTGVTVNPIVQVIQTRNVTPSLGTTNDSTVNLIITIPLLQGLGVEATAANEMSAKKDLEATVLTLRYYIAANILSAVNSYWDYLGAVKSLEQRKDLEARAEKNFQDVKKLIEGDEKPASDIEPVSANLANRTAQRLAAQQSLVEAKHALGLAMGLPSGEIESLSLPSDDFPQIVMQDIEKVSTALDYFCEQSLLRRADYEAAQKSEESAKILLVAAKNGLLPQLNLQLGAGYSGLEEGSGFPRFVSSLENNIPGVSGTVSLNYKFPVENNTARGLLLQRRANYQKAIISTKDIARTIGSSVSKDLSALLNDAQELQKYEKAVEHWKKAVENQKKQFLSGLSTVNDMITIEDNLSNALVNWIAAELAFSKALAQLRFDTGTLFSTKDDQIMVGMNELVTIPFLQDIGIKAR